MIVDFEYSNYNSSISMQCVMSELSTNTSEVGIGSPGEGLLLSLCHLAKLLSSE